MTQTIEDDTRRRVAEFLPDAIRKTLESYRGFVGTESLTDSKLFSAHHTACKVAIAHLELLLKLARWAEIPDKNAKIQDEIHDLLASAEDEVTQHKSRINKDDFD